MAQEQGSQPQRHSAAYRLGVTPRAASSHLRSPLAELDKGGGRPEDVSREGECSPPRLQCPPIAASAVAAAMSDDSPCQCRAGRM
jgi:hypothetical protein